MADPEWGSVLPKRKVNAVKGKLVTLHLGPQLKTVERSKFCKNNYIFNE